MMVGSQFCERGSEHIDVEQVELSSADQSELFLSVRLKVTTKQEVKMINNLISISAG